MSRRTAAAGFTIIELMIVVAVTAVILTLAVPSMYQLIVRQRVKAINAALVTDLQYARSEAVSRRRSVQVSFRADHADMTCYTIHTLGIIGSCDCRNPPGSACFGFVELRTVQVPRSTTVTVTAPDNYVFFNAAQGDSNRSDFRVVVESPIAGKLRTSTNLVGRPQVCSPEASFAGLTPCAD